MWSFIQEAQKTVFDVIAPALGPEGEIETAVLNGDMGGATRIAEQNRLMLSHVRTSYNKNMLHVACSRANNMEMIQYLLSCGVDLRGTTDNRERIRNCGMSIFTMENCESYLESVTYAVSESRTRT